MLEAATERAQHARSNPGPAGPRQPATPLPGSSARTALASELLRAAGNALLVPPRTALFLTRVRDLRRDLCADLERECAVEDAPAPRLLPARPLRFLVSSAEPSGERHALHLIEALQKELALLGAPAPEFLALGGERTRALGIDTVGDPLARAAMGADPLRSLPFYARLLARTAERASLFRPDVFLPVDSPALHVPLARMLKRSGLRTVHFVAPQYWGWAPWRVRAYREAVDLALAILPFEPAWFARHGVRAVFVGHPELDGLPPAPPASSPERASLVLLPGSRPAVVRRNLPWMLECAARLRARRPALEVVIAHDRPELQEELERVLSASDASRWARLALGDLQGELARARAALSVSGTVLIDLLHQRLPAAVIYRLRSRAAVLASRHLFNIPWFSSVNLLARRPVYWEACFRGTGPMDEAVSFLERAWTDPAFRVELRGSLDEAARRLGPPGAVRRAARHVLAFASGATPAPATPPEPLRP